MRVALGLSYNGQAYQGWQSQSSGLTVQDKLEAALGRFAAQRVSTLCAGRTDANLPRDIAVQWAMEVPNTFHCRASAKSRRYAYVLYESVVRPSIDHGRVGWAFRALDGDAMRTAANMLLGEHDFTSFRASQCQALSPVKNMMEVAFSKRGSYWRIEFEANAFLHHMIRNIMGCLVQIGQGKKPPEWMAEVMAARDRRAAAPTFSPDGLYFLGPRYDAQWGIPDSAPAYDGLP